MKLLLVLWMMREAVLPLTANCGSFFELVGDNGEVVEEGFLHKEFFTCSRDERCHFVVQNNRTKKHRVLKDGRDTTKLRKQVFKWRKRVPDEEISQSLSKYRR